VRRRGVICGGCWLVDYNNAIDLWPEEETLAVILSREVQGGGPAHNMAIDLARLGGDYPVWGVGVLGDDDAGRLILAACARHGIDSRRIRVAPGALTGHTDVMTVRSTGRRTFFHHQGANGLVAPGDFVLPDLPARILHVGAPGIHAALDAPCGPDPSGWVSLLRRARADGLRTNLEMVSSEPGRLRELAGPCLPHLDSIIINDHEAGALTGIEVVRRGATSLANARRAAAALVELGVAGVAAVHFPAGVAAATRDGRSLALPSLRVPPEAIRSANGAGDALAAGLLHGLHEDWELEDALRLGLCAAAASLRSVSTTGSVGTVAECLALGREWGWRDSLQ